MFHILFAETLGSGLKNENGRQYTFPISENKKKNTRWLRQKLNLFLFFKERKVCFYPFLYS